MTDMTMDQATGLRRIFRMAPPRVLAVVPCGAVTTPWVADQLQMRARTGGHILALDEWECCGNLGDCLGVSPRFDLAQAAAGQVRVEQCLCEAMPGLRLASAACLARALGTERIASQRCLDLLRTLQAGSDEWLLMIQAGNVEGLSPLALAVPRVLMVVDSHPQAVAVAWAALARLVRAAPEMVCSICQVAENAPAGDLAVVNFCHLAETRLGVKVQIVADLGEAFELGGKVGGVFADAYIQRLVQTSHVHARMARKTRFPGINAHDGSGLS